MTTTECKNAIDAGAFDAAFGRLYPAAELVRQKPRYAAAIGEFERIYGEGRKAELFSAPGRTEIGGNHTDHQRGRVLAAAVNLDIICVAAINGENIIRIKSEGYPEDIVDLASTEIAPSETGRAAALVRGVAARFIELGYRAVGFDAYTTSDVLGGSGLSSSAAFEVAVGTMLNHLCNGGAVSAVEIAQIGQYAENVYFGKPCGLMDQTASAVGGFVAIDFEDPSNPVVKPVPFDFAASGHTLCIVDTKGDHADLTGEYAAITAEMRSVAALFGAEFLREVGEDAFYGRLREVREKLGDRAALRAIHFFGDNTRARAEAAALESGDFEEFKRLVVESGRSSFQNLQNVFVPSDTRSQGLTIALALSERLLAGRGAWRVHGGGFAGTIQAFVPDGLLGGYRAAMEDQFGAGSCHALAIRRFGGVKISEVL